MSKEAMKLALEALENLCEHLPFDWAFDELKSLAGKDKYRKDLAKARSLIPIIEEALAKQEQDEPVAWMHKQGNHKEPSLRQLDDWEISNGWEQYSLYITPQQRKPLTDEQIDTLANAAFENYMRDKNDDFDRAFARAIEAAHGIKE